MSTIDLRRPAAAPSRRLARLTGHLEARLLDFGPGGPQVLGRSLEEGWVDARFPGLEAGQALALLSAQGVYAARHGDAVRFWLDPLGRFEDLDRLWGCLFQLL